MKTESNELAVKFLLGKLSEEEQNKIEESYFQNNALFEDIRIAENDLIDEYVAGALSAEDRRRFENRLLLNPQQRQKVEFAKTLIQYASNQTSFVQERAIPLVRQNWWSFISQILSAKPMFSLSFATAMLVVISVALWWTLNDNLKNSSEINRAGELAQIQTPEQIQNPETAPESANETNVKNEAEVQKTPALRSSSKSMRQSSPKKQIEPREHSRTIISTIVLPLGLTRGAEAAQVIEIPAKADQINIRIKFEEGEFASYSAVIETVEGRQIWSRQQLKPRKGKSDKALTVTIPSHLLKRGDYIISLKGLTEKGAYEGVGDYSFTVNRR